MKKRIACLLLTLIMLVSLVPVTALTASAASLNVSEAAITVLKKLTPFKDECYQLGTTQDVRIGYGTVCKEKHSFTRDGSGSNVSYKLDTPNPKHTIKQNEADTALRAALADYAKKVNSFAGSNGLTLSQNQFDALVIFSYGEGTSWMNGNGALKTAVVNKADSNTLLTALMTYGNESRRRVEANMYVNGIYSNVLPTSLAKVTYDPNGGVLAQSLIDGKYVMYFDTTKTIGHIAAPTKSGHTFLGWYRDGTALRPSLTSDCADKELKALWQPNGLSWGEADKGKVVKYTLKKSQLASRVIYSAPNGEKATDTKVTTDSVTVTMDYIGTDNTRWAQIGTNQWVIVTAGKDGLPNSSSNGAPDIDVTVTVTNSYVNMRVNASIFSKQNGQWKKGDQLRIIYTANADGFLWGQVAESDESNNPVGWVALRYTNWNSVKDNVTDNGSNGSGSGSGSTGPDGAVATATITFPGYVNVRSDAGTDNKIVGSLAHNETVYVYEIKTVNGHQWGRTTAGWFCMTYANVTLYGGSDSKISDEGAIYYTFSGKAATGGEVRVAPGTTNEAVDFTDAKGNHYRTIGGNTAVTVANMKVVDGVVWARATWKNEERNKENEKITVTRSGWVKLAKANVDATPYSDDKIAEVQLDPVKFTVVSDEVSVREKPGNSEDLVIKLNKGVEVEITKITLVGENIWGYTNNYEVDVHTDRYDGWINLASKYVSRSSLVDVEDDNSNPDARMTATVINTDSVRVRNTGSTTSGKVIGSLSRGATVRVWEVNDDASWYKVDSNKNGEYDYEEDGWVSGQYLQLADVEDDDPSGDASNGSSDTPTRTTGTGIVANTYSGVNVRQGAGTAYAAVGKLLPGTVVNILETTTVGAAKWGRVNQGWICMDYVTMISYDEIPGNAAGNDPSKGTLVDSLDKVEKTSTTAVYTGSASKAIPVYRDCRKDDDQDNGAIVRYLNPGDPITMYELLAVTDIVNSDVDGEDNEENDGSTDTTTTVTSYWARVNDGYIYNPAGNITLDGLDEKVHTLTGSDTLHVRDKAGDGEILEDQELKKGDQVKVTRLQIIRDKVWGLAEDADGYEGWIRLDYMSEGAYYVNDTNNNGGSNSNNNTGSSSPIIGSSGNTGSGGFVTNSSGYKYTGKVIRNGNTPLKVRSSASTGASVTTTLNNGASLVIYETTVADNMAWGRCDAGWVYLYYVDLTPAGGSNAIDALVVYNENTIAYTDSECTEVAGTYSRMSVVDVYEVVGKMARTDLGWVNTDNLA